MPEEFVCLHLTRNCDLLFVLNCGAKVLLQERVQTYLVLVARVAEVFGGVADNSVRYLGVKNAVAVDSVRIDEC